MSRAVLLGALALAVACAQDRPVRVSTAQSKTLGSDTACAVGDGQPPGLPADGLEPAATPVRPVFQSKPLLPPQRPGESVSEMTGCLAPESRTEGGGARSPAAGHSVVRLNPIFEGMIVTHELDHACCLRAEISTAVEGAQLRVMEILSGTPCRCRCASTIRTAVGLAPGTYTVWVAVQEPDGRLTVAHTGEVTLAP